MHKKRHKNDLDVDFIGGEELTKEEEVLLKDYFSKKKKTKRSSAPKNKEKVK